MPSATPLRVRRIASDALVRLVPQLINQRRLKRGAQVEHELCLLPSLCDHTRLMLDVGANYGLYTHHALKLSSGVLAFEPLPSMQDFLWRCYKNKITLHRCALSNVDGIGEIRMPQGNTSWATLQPTNRLDGSQTPIETHSIRLCKLDTLDIRNVGFVKIDVEGYEESVVEGAACTLERERPNLLIECEERHNVGSVVRLTMAMRRLSFQAFFLSGRTVEPFGAFDLKTDQARENVGASGKSGRYINNFIFIPEEKVNATLPQLRRLASRQNFQ